MVNGRYNQKENDKLLHGERGDELGNYLTIFVIKLILIGL